MEISEDTLKIDFSIIINDSLLNNNYKKEILKKGDYLIKPGDFTLFLAYIKYGSFRIYNLDKNGNEKTTWFGFKDMWVTDLLSYFNNTKAVFYVQALENSEVYIIKKSTLEDLYKNNLKFSEFGRKFAEIGLTYMMERTYSLQVNTAEDRYKMILKSSLFKQNIPLKFIASYLGITDSSLSRIRKKILK